MQAVRNRINNLIVAILKENVELARIIGASIRTAKTRSENNK